MSPRFIPHEEIAAAADAFRSKHDPNDTIPFPIEQVIEFSLKIDIVPIPGLLSEHGIDGFHSIDGKEIHIDQEQLERFHNRARFTLAHEVGHLVLHADYLSGLTIDNIDDWKRVVLGRGAGHAPLETQANMFAAFLLLPAPALAEQFAMEKEVLRKNPLFQGQKLPEDDILVQYMARTIARHFNVSELAAQSRLSNWLRKGC